MKRDTDPRTKLKPKLELERRTLRRLDDAALGAVAGGRCAPFDPCTYRGTTR